MLLSNTFENIGGILTGLYFSFKSFLPLLRKGVTSIIFKQDENKDELKRPPRYLAQLSIWRGAVGILEQDTQLTSLKIQWIQRLLNPTNALWKDLILTIH